MICSVAAEAPEYQNTYVCVLAHESREAAKKSWDDFRNDPGWKEMRDQFGRQPAAIMIADARGTAEPALGRVGVLPRPT